MRRRQRVWAFLAVSAALAGACAKQDGGAADAGSDVAAADGSSVDAGANDAGANDADANDATTDGDANDANADARAWTHYEFPESGYPAGWLVASQGNSPNNWAAATTSGASTLNLFTSDVGGGVSCADNAACPAGQCVAGTCRQRVKQKSPRLDFGFGTYEWRVFIPAFAPADAQFAVGAFVYADDAHELDFECGPGTTAARGSATLRHLGGGAGPALATEMLCVLTSQANPAISTPVAVASATWHTFALDLAPDGAGHYGVTWRIDGLVAQAQQLTYGPADACDMYLAGRKCTWQAFISTENLGFLGDTYPTGRNDAYFDWFRYAP